MQQGMERVEQLILVPSTPAPQPGTCITCHRISAGVTIVSPPVVKPPRPSKRSEEPAVCISSDSDDGSDDPPDVKPSPPRKRPRGGHEGAFPHSYHAGRGRALSPCSEDSYGEAHDLDMRPKAGSKRRRYLSEDIPAQGSAKPTLKRAVQATAALVQQHSEVNGLSISADKQQGIIADNAALLKPLTPGIVG